MEKRYEPFPAGSEGSDQLVRARKRCARMTEADHRGGFAAPEECSLDGELRTILAALAASYQLGQQGDAKGSSECFFEGVAMLQSVELTIRKRVLDLDARIVEAKLREMDRPQGGKAVYRRTLALPEAKE